MLQTRHVPAADSLVLAPGVELARARAHEATGPARTVFALLAAGRLQGPVLWLQSTWSTDRLMGDGIRRFLDPARLVFGRARTPLLAPLTPRSASRKLRYSPPQGGR